MVSPWFSGKHIVFTVRSV